jgi:hypothetical protein
MFRDQARQARAFFFAQEGRAAFNIRPRLWVEQAFRAASRSERAMGLQPLRCDRG